MESSLSWLLDLDRSYRLLVLVALATGVLGVVSGLSSGNPAFVLIGVSWLVGGPVVVWVATHEEG